MHPLIWKTLTALLLLLLLAQQFGTTLWQHPKPHILLHQERLGVNHTQQTQASSAPAWAYDWTRDRNNHALSTAQCAIAFPSPKFVHELDRAWTYWHGRNLTPDMIELYEGNEAGVRLLLHDQHFRIVQTRGLFREDFRQRILAVVNQLHRAISGVESIDEAPFRDTEFTIVVDDWLSFPKDREVAPWAFTRQLDNDEQAGVWLVPDFNFWSAPPVAGPFPEMQARAREHDARIADKRPQVVWRGVDWTNPEVRGALLDITAGEPWADVQKIDWANATNLLTLDEFCRHAFVVNTEGRSWSSRLTHLLNCDSVPVLHDLGWMAHYYHLLEPDVNFVPVRRDFSDLAKKVKFYIEHPDVAQRIADNARSTFHERYTTPAATACYWRRLLRSWTSVAFAPEGYEEAGQNESQSGRRKKMRGVAFEDFLLHDNTVDYPYE